MREDIKVVFMGTPEFAKCSLEKLVESKYNVVGVFTNPDKPAGRGMKLKPSPVKEYATKNNITVFQPVKLRNNDEVINILKELEPDIICVVAYGKILPKEVLDYPRLGCVNVHGSLLPKYRGAAPMQWAIINGEEKTGITTMYMDEGMDTGDMLLKEEIKIEEEDNLESIHDKLMNIGGNLLVKTLDKIVDGSVTREKQSNEYTLAPMITKEMTKIDFSKTSREIFNFVRGLSPFPGTYMVDEMENKYKVYKVKVVDNNEVSEEMIENNKGVGTIVKVSKNELVISTSDGYINILEIQPPNSKRMNISAFLNGNTINVGNKFV